MAKVLKISDATLEADFVAGPLVLAEAGWAYKTDREPISDVIECVSGDTDANIRIETEKLDKLFRRARDYAEDPESANPVYFTWQSEGEAATRRSLVTDGDYEVVPGRLWTPLLGGFGAIVRVAVTHLPDWEDSSLPSVASGTISALGGTWVLAAPGGSEDAQISKLTIASAAGGSILNKIWLGIRPTYQGTSHFQPVWGFRYGLQGVDTGIPVDDATANAGKRVTCGFATDPSLAWRADLRVDNFLALNYSHMVGSYLALARLKLDAGTTQIRSQLRAGWLGNYSYQAVVGETYLDGAELGTEWQVVPIGSIKIPPETGHSALGMGDFDFSQFGVMLYLERLSAGGSISLDELYLVPDKHMLTVTGAGFSGAGGSVKAYAPSDGDPFANGFLVLGGGGTAPHQVITDFTSWRIPADGGVMVAVGSRDAGGLLDANFSLTILTTKRWSGFRSA